MKAISLWQPWASLMAMGSKKIETRGHPIRYRGTLLIHAAKKVLPLWMIQDVLNSVDGIYPRLLPRGCLLCRVDIIDCKQVNSRNAPPLNELPFGDFRTGRYMWITDNLVTFDPIPFSGSQGLFNVPDDLLSQDLLPRRLL